MPELGLHQAPDVGGAVAAAVAAAAAAVHEQSGGIYAGCVRRVHHSIGQQIVVNVQEIVKKGAVRRAADRLLQTLEVLIGDLQGPIHGLALGLLHCIGTGPRRGGERWRRHWQRRHTWISTMNS